MINWSDVYTPMIEKELEGVAFMPMTGDTATVTSDLNRAHLWFSGAVLLGFKGAPDVLLTWHLQRQCLTTARESDWQPFSLDRIVMSPESPWDKLHRAKLQSVHLFSGIIELNTGEEEDIVAARHDFAGSSCRASLWVCTGYCPYQRVGEGDDMYVGMEAPTNLADLKLSISIGRVS
jgi:hypothetical protein